MNPLTTLGRQLVRTRLWPVAALLVAALAAVPVLLSRDAEPVAAPATPPAASSSSKVSASLSAPVVDEATPEQRSRRRRVLGVRKDPFTPESIKHPKKKTKKAKVAAKKTPPAPQEPTPTQSGGSTPTTSTPVAPVVTTPAKPKKTYAKGTLIIRFGDATSDALERMALPKLGALPKADTEDVAQLLVYTGLTKNGKNAIFLVDESLQPTGDGNCKPSERSCETIELSKGETEFFDVLDPDTGDVTAQYELDIVDIK